MSPGGVSLRSPTQQVLFPVRVCDSVGDVTPRFVGTVRVSQPLLLINYLSSGIPFPYPRSILNEAHRGSLEAEDYECGKISGESITRSQPGPLVILHRLHYRSM